MDRIKEVEQMAILNGANPEEYCQQVIGNAVNAIAYMSLKNKASMVVIGDSSFMVSLTPIESERAITVNEQPVVSVDLARGKDETVTGMYLPQSTINEVVECLKGAKDNAVELMGDADSENTFNGERRAYYYRDEIITIDKLIKQLGELYD